VSVDTPVPTLGSCPGWCTERENKHAAPARCCCCRLLLLLPPPGAPLPAPWHLQQLNRGAEQPLVALTGPVAVSCQGLGRRWRAGQGKLRGLRPAARHCCHECISKKRKCYAMGPAQGLAINPGSCFVQIAPISAARTIAVLERNTEHRTAATNTF
jgi:hypothetical protein